MISKPSIFVSIASYRDPELIPTIEDMLQTWSGETCITINVCLQDTEFNCMEVIKRNFPNLFVDFVDYKNSKGVCNARKRLQEMVRNETYFLQIDSHMRFIPNWDQELVSNLLQTKNPKAILSCYPPSYKRSDTGKKYLSAKYCNITEYFETTKTGSYICLGGKHNKTGSPVSNVRISAGFIFTVTQWIHDVPYPDEIYFTGEEDWLTVMSYTKGWDIFCPNKAVLYHCYIDTDGKYRSLHWEDHLDVKMDNPFIKNLYKGKYSKGNQRTIDQLFKCIERQTPCIFLIKLDIDKVPERKYKVWVFCLLDEHDNEIYRQDIYDQSILSHRSGTYKLDCEYSTWKIAKKYMIWPVNEKGDFEDKIILKIKDWDTLCPNNSLSYKSDENDSENIQGLGSNTNDQDRFAPIIKLDIDQVPERKYKVWVFCLLDEHDNEIYRQDIYDQSILSHRSGTYKLDCEYSTWKIAKKYMIWPVNEKGDFETKIILTVNSGCTK